MNNLEIYIIYHDQKSLQIFQENNKHIDTSRFKFILVGDYNGVGEIAHESHIISSFLPDNIERFESLLTFTAWYSLVRNNLINSKYVGLFEYDCVFNRDIFELEKELDQDKIIGFSPRLSKEHLYLDIVPEFCEALPIRMISEAKKINLWNATTNIIAPKKFLESFVVWYFLLIRDLLDKPKHSHFHERAINILTASEGIKWEFYVEYVKHKRLNSHNNKLQK